MAMRSVLTAVLLAALAGGAQKPAGSPPAEEPATIKVDVDVVNLLCSVRDKKGGLVSTLGKDDFQVFEEGKEQSIRYFSRETELPLTLGLLVDVSLSQERLIGEEKQAAYQFFQQVLRKKDVAFLISFGSDAELLQDLTGSASLLEKGLDRLRVVGGVGGLHPGPVPTAGQPRGTVLYDAVYLAATDRLQSEVGRKAMVLITDGIDQGSRVPWSDGRIDDPNAGWKGKALWTTTGTRTHFHNETGKGGLPKAIKIQLRPDPLAR